MFGYRNLCLIQRIVGQFTPLARAKNNQLRWCASQPDNQRSALIDAAIEKNSLLASYGKRSIQQTFDVLIKAGFTPENSMQVIAGHPLIVRFQPKQLEDKLETWHVCQFSHTQMVDLMVQCPEVLEIDDENYLRRRIADLKMFANTDKNIWRLLMASPNVLTDNVKMIKAKVNYILYGMKADITDLVKSGALGLPLEKIQSRHMLLVRLGIYKPKHKNANPLDSNKNPRLTRIMDAQDEEFAAKTCGISLNELNAFYDLYNRELEEKRKEEIEYELDDDSDYSDSDDESNYDPREKKMYDDRNRRKYDKRFITKKK